MSSCLTWDREESVRVREEGEDENWEENDEKRPEKVEKRERIASRE